MTTLGCQVYDNHKVGSIYDDYFHSKHYIARMNDLFTEILQVSENETNRSDAPSTTVRL